MIGVFDSGLGGLSVLSAIVEQMPPLDYLYCADSAHIPYGNKSPDFIADRVLALGQYLHAQGCQTIVVACNTATTSAIHALRQRLPNTPIVGVEPGIKPAAQQTQSGRIAVLATELTAQSERLSSLIQTHAQKINVAIVPCANWATMVESLSWDRASLLADMREKILPLLKNGVDRLVLGCTHYSFLSPLLHEVCAGFEVQLIDVAQAVAQQVKRVYSSNQAGLTALASPRIHLLATAHIERLSQAPTALQLPHLARHMIDCRWVQI